MENRPHGVWVVSLSHKGVEEERVAALYNRRLEEGRVISALHTVRPLTVPRMFEVVLKELNDRQRYVDRYASVTVSMNTSTPAAPVIQRGICALCRPTKRHTPARILQEPER